MDKKFIYFICLLLNVVKIILADENKIINYFNTGKRLTVVDTFQTIQNHWQTQRKSFENALTLILEQDYGRGGLNIYIRKLPDFYKISDGFYFSDNVVDLLLLETLLVESPILISPEVTFPLASNYLHIEARLGKIILSTNYLLARNQSDVLFSGAQQDVHRNSPFTFQQVQDSGELTITAQECNIAGYTITSFSGNSVTLGLDTFKVTNCKFSVEIYSTGLGSPPVFGPYFSKPQCLAIEAMLSNAMRAELMPKLQSAVFTYVNTSAIFGEKLPELRHHLKMIFKKTWKYTKEIVGDFLKSTIKNTDGIIKLKPVQILWNRTCLEGTCGNFVKLKEVVLYGLDTAYSSHIGGPFKSVTTKVAETIRFSTMQVRGKIDFENTTVAGQYDFAVELRDVAVNVELEEKSNSFVFIKENTEFIGWRTLEFSIIELNDHAYERKVSQSFITGYLINEIPKQLIDHISENFKNLKNKNEHEVENENLDKDRIKTPSEGNIENDKNEQELENENLDKDRIKTTPGGNIENDKKEDEQELENENLDKDRIKTPPEGNIENDKNENEHEPEKENIDEDRIKTTPEGHIENEKNENEQELENENLDKDRIKTPPEGNIENDKNENEQELENENLDKDRIKTPPEGYIENDKNLNEQELENENLDEDRIKTTPEGNIENDKNGNEQKLENLNENRSKTFPQESDNTKTKENNNVIYNKGVEGQESNLSKGDSGDDAVSVKDKSSAGDDIEGVVQILSQPSDNDVK